MTNLRKKKIKNIMVKVKLLSNLFNLTNLFLWFYKKSNANKLFIFTKGIGFKVYTFSLFSLKFIEKCNENLVKR